MSNFDDLCRNAQSLSPETKKEAIIKTLDSCISGITQVGLSESDALQTVIGITCCAIAADGRFNSDEYPYIAALLQTRYSGSTSNYSYENCYSYINNLRSGDLHYETTKLIKSLGSVNTDLKNNLIMLCLLICSVDGYVSSDEKSFLLGLF